MTNIADGKWPIEIDGLPFLKMGESFHGELLNNQNGTPVDSLFEEVIHLAYWGLLERNHSG